MTKTKHIQLYGLTDVGCVRTGNEDCFIIQPMDSERQGLNPDNLFEIEPGGNLFAAVSDGMGGAVAGELASQTALTTLTHYLCDHDTALKDASPKETVGILEEGLYYANESILQKVRETNALRGMGATLTAAFIKKDIVYMLQVGDSRAYVLRDGKLIRITRDQSFVGHLVEMGTITESQAMKHPQRNVILQALGTQRQLKVDVSYLPLCRGDLVLLCSDGLYSEFLPDQLADRIQAVAERGLTQGLGILVHEAKMAGGKDNITVIGLEINEAAPPREPGEDARYLPFPFLDEDNPFEKTQSLFQ